METAITFLMVATMMLGMIQVAKSGAFDDRTPHIENLSDVMPLLRAVDAQGGRVFVADALLDADPTITSAAFRGGYLCSDGSSNVHYALTSKADRALSGVAQPPTSVRL